MCFFWVCCSFLVDHKVCQEVLAGSILLDPFLVTFIQAPMDLMIPLTEFDCFLHLLLQELIHCYFAVPDCLLCLYTACKSLYFTFFLLQELFLFMYHPPHHQNDVIPRCQRHLCKNHIPVSVILLSIQLELKQCSPGLNSTDC